jgi:hypothetical protein
MSELIMKDNGEPFATHVAAKSKRTRMGEAGLETNIVKVDGGFALEKKKYERPKKRIPLGQRNVLTVPKEEKDPGYEHRWVNDKDGRINMFRDAGWELVGKPDGMQVGDPNVGSSARTGALVTKSVGGEIVAYLMRIKKEFYKEDQEAKAQKIREGEADLKMEEKKQGRYGDIKINEERKY